MYQIRRSFEITITITITNGIYDITSDHVEETKAYFGPFPRVLNLTACTTTSRKTNRFPRNLEKMKGLRELVYPERVRSTLSLIIPLAIGN